MRGIKTLYLAKTDEDNGDSDSYIMEIAREEADGRITSTIQTVKMTKAYENLSLKDSAAFLTIELKQPIYSLKVPKE